MKLDVKKGDGRHPDWTMWVDRDSLEDLLFLKR